MTTLIAQGPVDVNVRGLLDAMIDPLQDASIELAGLSEVLCSQMQETIGRGEFTKAQSLAWAYDCLSSLADKLARELSDAAP
jgi:hypothetical protein